ncbi:MAG: beta-ketoacyl-[acyl-carrier-protein] synthase family protein [Bacteroidales bacterium]|nr:beta-ketoacyl-[acyl-carrier-protein] synthase family protein [Bacteroidales bacterium]
MQNLSRIGITGLGVICAIGNNADEVLYSLKKGVSGIGPVRYLQTRHTEIPVGEVKLSNREMADMLGLERDRLYSRTSLMGAISIRQALRQTGIRSLAGKRVAVISGTTVGVMDLVENFRPQILRGEIPDNIPSGNECGHSTREMAEFAGIPQAQCCTISTACSSALNSIITGCEMLQRDEADIVIAGGSEALSRFHLNGFNSLMILDKKRCRPFDATRAGLNLGEGAAFVVMQKNPTDALSYVAGYGNRCDAFHQTASSENGDGAFLAMSDALSMAGLRPEDIGYVNAHGTGTPDNDISESRAIRRLFKDTVPPVSSTKAFTGHTTSASGSIEAVICILAIRHGFLPANLGWKNLIEGGIRPTNGKKGVALKYAMCNSFGFGGNDSSIILSGDEFGLQYADGDFAVETLADEKVCDVESFGQLKEYVSPMESRRMGKLMKAAILSAFKALKISGTECPDAIITGTSHGMQETGNRFLDDIIANGEELLSPTLFMQSTHNTIGSSIAIRTGCHGYNITYSQGDDSLGWALKDAREKIRSGRARTVLVGCYDESSEGVDARTLILGRK